MKDSTPKKGNQDGCLVSKIAYGIHGSLLKASRTFFSSLWLLDIRGKYGVWSSLSPSENRNSTVPAVQEHRRRGKTSMRGDGGSSVTLLMAITVKQYQI